MDCFIGSNINCIVHPLLQAPHPPTRNAHLAKYVSLITCYVQSIRIRLDVPASPFVLHCLELLVSLWIACFRLPNIVSYPARPIQAGALTVHRSNVSPSFLFLLFPDLGRVSSALIIVLLTAANESTSSGIRPASIKQAAISESSAAMWAAIFMLLRSRSRLT